MDFTNIIGLLGGIALFLYGMSVMGDSLKKVAGNKLEIFLYKLSSNPIKGILLGTGVTAVIQSSSATSVMTVGFVNSGMMKVRQAVGIILGAVLGTSITGWILCLNSIHGEDSIASYFSTAVITGVAALIGILLKMISKKQSSKYFGEILLGFAVLMFGMSLMSESISPLKESEAFISSLTTFSNPLLGILAGLIITSILQSASAAIGILQALAVTGAITFDVAFPLIMGIGIGASVPVLLSALGASVNGKRTAFVYLLIDVLGAVICGGIFYILNAVFDFSFMSTVMTMVLIALVNTLYRLIVVIILSPTTGLLEKLVCKLFPDNEESLQQQADMDRLESRFLSNPALAIEQSRIVIGSMAEKTRQNILEAVDIRTNYSEKLLKHVNDLEDVIDRYEDKIGNYLSKINQNNLSGQQAGIVGQYLHVLSDFERISDHAKNLGETALEIHEKKIHFTDAASRELDVLEAAVSKIVALSIDAFLDNDKKKASRVEPLEEVIDELCDEMKYRHVERIKEGVCTLENGFVFNDLLTNYERVADHCSNVALDVIETGMRDFHAHEYFKTMKTKEDPAFMIAYDEYQNAYRLPE